MTPASVATLSRRLGAALAVPHHVHGHQVRVGGSIGSYLAEPGVTVAEALHAADQAMYAVKKSRTSRNRCAVAIDSPDIGHRLGPTSEPLQVGCVRPGPVVRLVGRHRDACLRGPVDIHQWRWQPPLLWHGKAR